MLALFGFLYLSLLRCVAQQQDVLCDQGSGGFQTDFQSTGLTVKVGASKNGELATRRCDAVLVWGKQTLSVATNASQIDIDALGTDLGFGVPVVAFQVKQSDVDCCVQYRVYSLQKPPRLLRSLMGGSSFRAADTDLDGQVEIWTDDASAADGFEGLTLAEFSGPSLVLRFSRSQLFDVSPEFEADFDRGIAAAHANLTPDDLREFKNSDGRLSPTGGLSAERLHRLRSVKGRVLEIVCAYLYSGREEQAWRTLAEMWAPDDLNRIRAAVLQLLGRGIHAQISGASIRRPGYRKKRTAVFDAITTSAVIPPEPIMLSRPAGPDGAVKDLGASEINLLVDSAGKVRSAEGVGKAGAHPDLIRAASTWKFIPGFKDGHAVAARMRLEVSPKK